MGDRGEKFAPVGYEEAGSSAPGYWVACKPVIVIGILLLQDKFLGSRWNMVLPQSEDFMQTEQF